MEIVYIIVIMIQYTLSLSLLVSLWYDSARVFVSLLGVVPVLGS